MTPKKLLFRVGLITLFLLTLVPLCISFVSAGESNPKVQNPEFKEQGQHLPAAPLYLHLSFEAEATAENAQIRRENIQIDIEITEQTTGAVHQYTLTADTLENTHHNNYEATFYLAKAFEFSDLNITSIYIGDSAGNVTQFNYRDAFFCHFTMAYHSNLRINKFAPVHDTIIITPDQPKGEVFFSATIAGDFSLLNDGANFTVNLRSAEDDTVVSHNASIRQAEDGNWVLEFLLPVTKQDEGNYILDSISYDGKLVSTNHSFSFVVINNAKLHHLFQKVNLPTCYAVTVGLLILLLVLFTIWPHPLKWLSLYILEGALALAAGYLAQYYDNLPGGFFGGFTYMGEVLSSMITVLACAILASITIALNITRPHKVPKEKEFE